MGWHLTFDFRITPLSILLPPSRISLMSIRPGSLLIAKPGEYHNSIFKTTDPYKRYVIRFNPHTVYPYVRRQLEKAESVYYIEGSPIVEEFHRMDEYVMLILWKSDGELA